MAETILEPRVREVEAIAPLIAPVKPAAVAIRAAPEAASEEETNDEVPEAFRDAFAPEPRLSPFGIPIPDVSHLITEDDTPVDNLFSEKQQRLLVEPLYSSWKSDRPFEAFANVGIYASIRGPAIVPDAYLSLDVKTHEDIWAKEHRCYMIWEYGKPPDVVIEIVSNKKGGENDTKLVDYARLGASFYVVFDPRQLIQNEMLVVYERRGEKFVRKADAQFEGVGLGIVLWDGAFEGSPGKWLRWCDRDGNVIATGAELAANAQQMAEEVQRLAEQERLRAEQEQLRADQEQLRAEQEQQRADQERLRAERLIAQLRALGVEPEA